MRDLRTVLAVGGVVSLVALGALAATLAGGGSGGDGSANGSIPVEDVAVLNGQWTVVDDGSAPAPVQGVVRLVLGDGRVFAETGCNTVRGPVTVEDSVLVTTGPLMSTRMACEPALMEQEQWITQMLGSRPRLERSGPYLYLHWGDGEQWWLGLESANETLPAS